LGIKGFAVCSDGSIYKNIKKTATVKKLKKKFIRLQKQVSRKYEINKIEVKGKDGENRYKLIKTNNIRKLEYEIQAVRDRLNNIITKEDIYVSGIMKNKHLAKSIAQQIFYEFRRILRPIKPNGITLN